MSRKSSVSSAPHSPLREAFVASPVSSSTRSPTRANYGLAGPQGANGATLEVPDGSSAFGHQTRLQWVLSWGDKEVARWLEENKCGAHAQTFRNNDITGAVLLDVDQSALKELGVQSVGDRIKIVVAVKKLRQACSTSSLAPPSPSHKAGYTSPQLSPQRAAFARTNSPLSNTFAPSETALGARRLAASKGTYRIPPPLHLPSSSSRDKLGQAYQSASAASIATGTQSAQPFPSASSSNGSNVSIAVNGHTTMRGQDSPTTGAPRVASTLPPPAPPPKSSLPPPPGTAPRSRSGSSAQAPSIQTTTPSPVVATQPSVFGSSLTNPETQAPVRLERKASRSGHIFSNVTALGLSHRRGSSQSNNPLTGTGLVNPNSLPSLSSSRSGSYSSATVSTSTYSHPYAQTSSPAYDSFSTGSRQGQEARKDVGYIVGKGSFAKPSTPGGLVSVSAASNALPLEDVLRKTVKFIGDDGISKLVSVDDARDANEIMYKALRKFGKISAGQRPSPAAYTGNDTFVEMEGWGVFASSSDGQVKALTESELIGICQSISRPERQRGLTLRRLHHLANTEDWRSKHPTLRHKSEESQTDFAPQPMSPAPMIRDSRVPLTSVQPASPVKSTYSDEEQDYQHHGLSSQQSAERKRQTQQNRASTISVMSGLLDWSDAMSGADASPQPGQAGSQKGPLRSFLGHRPTSELISSYLADYFPAAEKKMLSKTARTSMRKSMAKRQSYLEPKSGEGLPRSWQNSVGSSRFSGSSTGSQRFNRTSGSDGTSLYEVNELGELLGTTSISPIHSPPTISEPELDGETSTASNRPSLRSHHSGSSRLSTSSRLSVARSGRDSDGASLLTVDEVTAELENRRLSTTSWMLDEDDDEDDDLEQELATSLSPDLDRIEPADVAEAKESEDRKPDAAGPQAITSKGSKASIKWIKGVLIGQGSFGQVSLGMNATNGTLMAVKQVERPTGSSHNEERRKAMIVALEREIDLLKTLQHENIVQYLDSSLDENHLNIFLEYVAGGSVTALLGRYGSFEETLVRNFLRGILQGLNYLHEKGIIHRDIKGANILVDNKGVVKISDFGISKRVEDGILSTVRIHRPSMQGSAFWMSPEAVKQTTYTNKADIWSTGCLVVEMLTGSHPWANLTQMQAIFRIGQSTSPEMPEDISSEAEDFLSQTFRLNHEERPSALALLHHPFLRGDTDPSQTPTVASFPDTPHASK
ncbi:uncharacterized protein L969DRAFT_53176 [Mixia osmundae IAM 14324]|uniref:mitogen-activated protein kinase kinase kinase n=1 Tax=Mixia osmundae (strain CBS 9802 / IAM 14324 / JCM 22182 / KY 12970) TaxID=764103 RepID=G7DWM0_MIXOS|nr:uncharacterized protein L969DRAFT_53176 [Mixia osmundae IAM 14324]KEI37381.1 hypothetical protein L969DRAFT_53176 [Mixia osmundae IAM 14324]GAA94980.1 hypothetical protein E5Q_01635 [Mixia osmundae IAM 14324]